MSKYNTYTVVQGLDGVIETGSVPEGITDLSDLSMRLYKGNGCIDDVTIEADADGCPVHTVSCIDDVSYDVKYTNKGE